MKRRCLADDGQRGNQYRDAILDGQLGLAEPIVFLGIDDAIFSASAVPAIIERGGFDLNAGYIERAPLFLEKEGQSLDLSKVENFIRYGLPGIAAGVLYGVSIALIRYQPKPGN
jgi:hypothetical protein